MSLAADLKILYHLTLSPVRGKTHAERLESFYKGQAEGYDAFRERLLHGRDELFSGLNVPEGGVWVDMGGGTGANLERFASRINRLKAGYVVDLSPSLLEVATKRIEQRGWSHVKAVHADVIAFEPEQRPVDLVTFSYSLTMIPDWFAAIDHAHDLLRPGGVIAVVDFYVSRKHADSGRARHSWWKRTFWPTWFNFDNVFPSPDHLPYLCNKFEPVSVVENVGSVKYLPGARMPYYQFVGRKPAKIG